MVLICLPRPAGIDPRKGRWILADVPYKGLSGPSSVVIAASRFIAECSEVFHDIEGGMQIDMPRHLGSLANDLAEYCLAHKLGVDPMSFCELSGQLFARRQEQRRGDRLIDWRTVDQIRETLNRAVITKDLLVRLLERDIQRPATDSDASQGDGGAGAERDDALPKSKRADSPSRVRARAAYEYAMAEITNAEKMTAAELFHAIKEDGKMDDGLPPTAESFTKYLNDCGIRLKKGDHKTACGSVVRRSDL